MSRNQEVLKSIQESYKNDRLVPFVGSGFSKNIEDFPDWDEFIKQLVLELKLSNQEKREFKKLSNNLERTEFFIRRKGRQDPNVSGYETYEWAFKQGKEELLKQMEIILNPSTFPYNGIKWNVHKLLIKKFPKMIYTSNWDDTLERKQLHNKKTNIKPKAFYGFSKKYNGEDEGRPKIVKYHGDLTGGKELLVSCLTDYHRRMMNDSILDIKFKNDLLRYDFLFLGYSFKDPNIQLLLYYLSDIMTNTNKFHSSAKINTKIFWVSIEKEDDLRVNLLNETFYSLVPYFLLDAEDYNGSGNPDPKKIKQKTKQLLNNLNR